MRREMVSRIGLSATLLSILVALGIFLFAQERPPSEDGYGGTGQVPCVCTPPSTPPAPNWIKVTEVRYLRKFAWK